MCMAWAIFQGFIKMSFQTDLLDVFRKYPFLHIDSSGLLTIVVPLTGAQLITDNFSKNQTNPIALYLFGDNTCKADLERRNFFDGTDDSDDEDDDLHVQTRPFSVLFENLIQDLTVLSVSSAEEQDKQFIQVLVDNLCALSNEVEAFHSGEMEQVDTSMDDDLLSNLPHFVSKGEFYVRCVPDSIRSLNLPNIRGIADSKECSERMIAEQKIPLYLESLTQIKPFAYEDKLTPLISRMLQKMRPMVVNLLSSNRSLLFQKLYSELKADGIFLPDIPQGLYKNMVTQLAYLLDPEEPCDTFSEDEITAAILSVVKQTGLVELDEKPVIDSFISCYQHAFHQYQLAHADGYEQRRESYQLFVLQTFLYLCVIQMRLKDRDCAKKFLEILQDNDESDCCITNFFCNEPEARKWLEQDFQITEAEYQAIVAATHEIVIAHIDAEHFDELRSACFPQLVSGSHYFVMSGRLNWSYLPISERCSSIPTPMQQKALMEARFEQFYNERVALMQQSAHMMLIQDVMDQGGDELLYELIATNIDLLPRCFLERLLRDACRKNLQKSVALLLQHKIFDHELLHVILKTRPINADLYLVLLENEPRYVAQLTGQHLLDALKHDSLQEIELILKYRPDLFNYQNQYRVTSLMVACSVGNVEIAKSLMMMGADIYVTAEEHDASLVFNGKKADDFAQRVANHSEFTELFHNYSHDLEQSFLSNPLYKNNITPEHFVHALEYKDVALLNVLVRHCSHLADTLSEPLRVQMNALIEEERKEARLRAAEIEKTRATEREHTAEMEREAQRMRQLELNRRVKCLEPEFDTLIARIGDLKDLNSRDRLVAGLLIGYLSLEANEFFNNDISACSFEAFQRRCKTAFLCAKPEFSTHLGWHTYNSILRAFLGIIAALTVIPALSVEFASRDGYIGTFFGRPKRLALGKLEAIESEIEQELIGVGLQLGMFGV